MKNLTIGQLAKETGTHVETIRYYERQGLIAEPPRRASGYREFPPEYVERIRFIKRLKPWVSTLREISELLAPADGNPACKDIRKFAEEKVKVIETRIHDLARIKNSCKIWFNSVEHKKFSGCPIIKSLSMHGDQGIN